MEIFLPSILIVLLAGVVVFTILPRFGPLVLTVIAIILLMFGVYHHYNLFYDEYRLSTWQTTSTFLAPALVLGVALFFLLGYILSFFGSGIPVPKSADVVPNVGETVANIVNTAAETVNNVANNVVNSANNVVNNVVNNTVEMANNVNRGFNNALRYNNMNQRNNNRLNNMF
jgi:predicted PurR-regulated permease PerM